MWIDYYKATVTTENISFPDLILSPPRNRKHPLIHNTIFNVTLHT